MQELFESFNDSAINEKIFVYELHLRDGEAEYAGAGFYYFIGYDYNRPSWIAIQNFIDFKTPDKSSVNLPTPYFLDLNENTLESNTNINFSDLLKKFNKKTIPISINKNKKMSNFSDISMNLNKIRKYSFAKLLDKNF